MPLTLDPNAMFKYVLLTDRDKPADKQPYFELKHRSHRRTTLIELQIRKATIEELIDILRDGLDGWGNMTGPDGTEIPFNRGKIEDILTTGEIGELLLAYRSQGWTAEERKNLPLQPDSGTGPAAKDARGPQNARTDPMQQAP